MRVASKVATGFGITIVLLLAVLIYDQLRAQKLSEVNRNFAATALRATTVSLEQSRILYRIDEFTRKQFVTSDPAYTKGLAGLHLEFWRLLDELSRLEISDETRHEIVELETLWKRYRSRFSTVAWEVSEGREVDVGGQQELVDSIASLQQRVHAVGESAQREMSEQAGLAAAAQIRAHQLYWVVTGIAALLSVLILWLTVRAINTPLATLIEGTRAVSQGEFSYRLDSSGQDEFSRLAGSFNEMVQRLEDAENVKKDFLSHVSHELKSPLASIEETTELLLEEIPGPLSAKQRRFLALNLDSGRRLSTMISRLLDLSRLEAGVMEYDLRVQDLSELVEQIVSEFEARARDVGLEIRQSESAEAIPVVCDRDRVHQVLQNLVDNALKESSAGQAIELRVARSEEKEDHVILQVLDRGPGVADEHKEKIFERFYQVPQPRRRGIGRGVGLGLAISKQIIDAHRGRIWVEDREGGGSVFSVALPLAAVVETTTPLDVENETVGTARG